MGVHKVSRCLDPLAGCRVFQSCRSRIKSRKGKTHHRDTERTNAKFKMRNEAEEGTTPSRCPDPATTGEGSAFRASNNGCLGRVAAGSDNARFVFSVPLSLCGGFLT